MAALAQPNPRSDPMEDYRDFQRIAADRLIIDQRKQRECDPEKVARIANEFDWDRFEVLTVAVSRQHGMFDVVEGQHRALGIRQLSDTVLVPCMVLPERTSDKRQSEIAYRIVRGRRPHSAYETWRLRFNAGEPHELAATSVLESRGLRVGKSPSAMTIAAAATVSGIIHNGGLSPEAGAYLLDRTIDVIGAAFPTHDHESNVSRWNRWMLLAVKKIVERNPEFDRTRLIRALRVRPAEQWLRMGADKKVAPAETIAAIVKEEYNRGLRKGRVD